MDLISQLQEALQSQELPLPSTAWLGNLVASRSPPPPLASLVATARARLLAADLTSPNLLDANYVATHSLPAATSSTTSPLSPDVREDRLLHDVVVQVLDIENLSRSRWDQVEELEAIERGEMTRGRHVVRLPTGAAAADGTEDVDGGATAGALPSVASDRRQAGNGFAPTSSGSRGVNATHKLLLQDPRGRRVFGLELSRVDRIGIGATNIGEKILLRSGTIVARGVIMLQPATCVFLGGKVEPWHKSWVDGRLGRLREAAQSGRRD
ncbi:hypothetical protein VTK73DRAFT_10106 [Phialemonium thermophilum]|uniref:RecQ mediated genome instability protein 1-like N-terminal helical domain-containing protein n=1 Tax=Phialemonium thermophilum TaxID=223376 RepID=A0ABR3XI11_9PEZI